MLVSFRGSKGPKFNLISQELLVVLKDLIT